MLTNSRANILLLFLWKFHAKMTVKTQYKDDLRSKLLILHVDGINARSRADYYNLKTVIPTRVYSSLDFYDEVTKEFVLSNIGMRTLASCIHS